MDASTRQHLFVLLRALDRISSILNEAGKQAPPAVTEFLDDLWRSLAEGTIKSNQRALKRALDQSIVDGQDAGHPETVLNNYLFVVDNLAGLLRGDFEQSLEGAEYALDDFFDYVAGQKYLAAKYGDRAVVLTNVEEHEIANSPDTIRARAAMNADRLTAAAIADWKDVLSLR